MDASESRATTIGLACFAATSVALFVVIYAPALSTVAPGRGIRPMTLLPLFVAALGLGGWIPCVVIGVRQLFSKPRYYGLLSIGIGALQRLSFRLVEWLLMDQRGIHWGT
jgi:hypothetical protein